MQVRRCDRLSARFPGTSSQTLAGICLDEHLPFMRPWAGFFKRVQCGCAYFAFRRGSCFIFSVPSIQNWIFLWTCVFSRLSGRLSLAGSPQEEATLNTQVYSELLELHVSTLELEQSLGWDTLPQEWKYKQLNSDAVS
jgi:hypothetical protein